MLITNCYGMILAVHTLSVRSIVCIPVISSLDMMLHLCFVTGR